MRRMRRMPRRRPPTSRRLRRLRRRRTRPRPRILDVPAALFSKPVENAATTMQSEETTERAEAAAADESTAIAGHPRGDDLARLVRTVALAAADERRTRFSDGLDELCAEAELRGDDGKLGGF